jgi:hypothetical protein
VVNFGQIYERSNQTSWVDWQNRFDGLRVKSCVYAHKFKMLTLSTGMHYSALIANAVIAPIAILRERFPLSMVILFPVEFLDVLFDGGKVDCTNLDNTDLIFETIGYK